MASHSFTETVSDSETITVIGNSWELEVSRGKSPSGTAKETEGFPGRKYGIPPTSTVCPLLWTVMDDCSAWPVEAEDMGDPVRPFSGKEVMMDGYEDRELC